VDSFMYGVSLQMAFRRFGELDPGGSFSTRCRENQFGNCVYPCFFVPFLSLSIRIDMTLSRGSYRSTGQLWGLMVISSWWKLWSCVETVGNASCFWIFNGAKKMLMALSSSYWSFAQDDIHDISSYCTILSCAQLYMQIVIEGLKSRCGSRFV